MIDGLSQIVLGARTASQNYYLSHIILHTVRAPGTICESPSRHVTGFVKNPDKSISYAKIQIEFFDENKEQ